MKKSFADEASYFVIILLLVLFVFGMPNAQAAPADSLNFIQMKQYERLREMGDNHYEGLAYAKAIELYKRTLKVRPSDDTVRLRIANSFFRSNQMDSAYAWYGKVIENDNLIIDQIHYINYAEVLTSFARYDEARFWYTKYQQSNPSDQRVKRRLKGFDNVLSFYKDSVRYSLVPVSFNSDTYDFSPCYYQDKILYVSARETPGMSQWLRAKYQLDKTYFLNLFVVDSSNTPLIFNNRIKTGYHEGPATFLNQDSTVIFTRNNFTKAEFKFKRSKLHVKGAEAQESNEGINKLKLFTSQLNKKGVWDTPTPLWFNSDEYSTGHPTISADQQRLYFSSDRPGSLGKSDLYVSRWVNGEWSEPVNLGARINSESVEIFPFIDEYDILYFASDGHEGLGGLDLFMVDLKDPKAEVINLGFPLNTTADDFGLILKNQEGLKSGYFSSNRPGGKGLDDIYQFTYETKRGISGQVVDLISGLPIDKSNVKLFSPGGEALQSHTSNAKGMFRITCDSGEGFSLIASKEGYKKDTLIFNPNQIGSGDTLRLKLMKEMLVIRGKALDDIKGTPLDSVRIFVTNHTTGKKFGMLTQPDGKYSFVAQPEMQYTILMKKHRFLSASSDISTVGKSHGDIVFIGRLEEIVIGKPIELNEIHFDLAKWNIRPDAAEELDHFVRQLTENPSIIVELDTHTDSRGGAEYNLTLSDHRAKSAAAYVIKHGIAKERIVGKGYGETRPLNKCVDGVKCTEEEHQKNRRAEFKVTGFLPEEESEEIKQWVWVAPDFIAAGISEADLQKLKAVETGSVEIKGMVKDTLGAGMSNVLITCIEKGINKTFQIKADSKGSFVLKVDKNKVYRIVAQLEGYEQEAIEVKVAGQDPKPIEINLLKK